MLSSTSPREALLAFPPFLLGNSSLFTVESTPCYPYSRSDPSLTRQGAALAHLDFLLPHDLVLWTDGFGRSASTAFLLLSQSLWQELSLVLSGYNGSPNTCFSQETTGLMCWPDRERYLRPPQPLVVSLLSLVSTLLFSRTGGVLSHRNSSTHRFPQFPPKNLCSLVMLAVFFLVYAAMDTAYC